MWRWRSIYSLEGRRATWASTLCIVCRQVSNVRRLARVRTSVVVWCSDNFGLCVVQSDFWHGSNVQSTACNTPDVIYPICSPTLAVSGVKLFYFLGLGFCLRVLLSLSCISYHVIMCIAFAYVFLSCIRAFSPLSVLHSGASFSSSGHF